jgi:hypothetical protein
MHVDRSYSVPYVRHQAYALNPSRYIRSFFLIQKDLQDLFEFIEPADKNLETYSLRVHELLVRTCIEVEANFKAIMRANKFSKVHSGANLSMADYQKVEFSHFLSDYDVWIPYWSGESNERTPFKAWKNGESIYWYQAYNSAKHDRHDEFEKATFDNLMDAVAGLVVLLSAQFYQEDFSPAQVTLAMMSEPAKGFDHAIGDYFGIKFPRHVAENEKYDFDWNMISKLEDPFQKFDYDNC